MNERRESQTGWTHLQAALAAFAADRDWQQFHTPKNLVMALCAEAGELVAEFQWLTPEEAARAAEPGELRDRVSEEAADVLIYLLRLADELHIDLDEAVRSKIVRNAARYPVETSAGNARKHPRVHETEA